MQTLLLDRTTWDLTADALGNIAVATEPYQLAQDAASSIKLFRAELYYDITQGIPYFQAVLGFYIPLPLVKAFVNSAALTVPGIASAQSFISMISGRTLRGQVQLTSAATGDISLVNF